MQYASEALVLLSIILAIAFSLLRLRGKVQRRGPKVPRYDAPKVQRAPRRPRFSRTPKQAPKPKPYIDARPQRERVMDLHLRGAIFSVTADAAIQGYDLTPLGRVKIDTGPAAETRMARAAAQQFPSANAVVSVAGVQHVEQRAAGINNLGNPRVKRTQVIHGMAVIAAPRDPAFAPPKYRDDLVLIDGSNVMNWYADAGQAHDPSLAPVTALLDQLGAQGKKAGVVFDASAGQRLWGRYADGYEFAALLPLAAKVLVVDKGTIADTVLIEVARSDGLVIISNDHFRDAPIARHLLKQKGYVEKGAITLLAPRA